MVHLIGSGEKGADGLSACVYTALTGSYEKLNEQAVATSSSIPFICLTDNPNLESQTWQIRHVEPLFKMDPIRSQRVIKIKPHEYLSGFDCSLYIDNSVILKAPPDDIIFRYLSISDFCLPMHSYRETVLAEFIQVEATGRDDQDRIFEQLNHYLVEAPEILDDRPFWTGIMLRRHYDQKVRIMSEIWSGHVQRYSRRDQLSVNYAFKRAGLKPEVIRIDNFSSLFHSWPNRDDSEKNKAERLASRFISFPAARVRELEQQNRERKLENESLRKSNLALENSFGAARVRELEEQNRERKLKYESLRKSNLALKNTLSKSKARKQSDRRLWRTIPLRVFNKLRSLARAH